LPPALGRQPVELRLAIVLGDAPFDRNPSPLDQSMQRWVQRALFDLQYIVRVEFNRLGDGVAVPRAQQQRAQNQQVQRALEQFNTLFLSFGRHSR
jgi:hypothetical protein